MNTVRRRLDSLEAYPSWFIIRLLLLTGFSWSLNAAECVLFTFARRKISRSVRMTTFAVEALGDGLFIGAVVGAPQFGHIAGAKGRRWALLLAKTLSLLGLVLSVMARKDYELIIARILAGIGFGGELPVATVLVHELTSKSMRGRMVALLHAFTGVGGVVGVALALSLEPRFGWRTASGRVTEAMQGVERLERAHGTRMIDDHAMLRDVSTEDLESSVEVVKPPMRDRATRVWMVWAAMELSGRALGIWTTMVLLGLAQIAGSVLASMMLEEVDPKKLLARCAASASLIAVVLSHSPWNGPVVIIGVCMVSALLAAGWSCALVYAPSNFSTEARGRGVGYAFGFSRLSAVIGAWLYPRMFNIWRVSVPAIAWMFAALLVAIVLWAVLPFWNGMLQFKEGAVLRDDRTTGSKVKLDDSESSVLLVRSHNKKEE
ncbi:hypothetical protein PHYSODRAFT_338336 [Phytophthora sojae]|uniref:Major facilitator superfamily (MFS) profile domain-containing protein n=1 Tax=Phytophthora sojae (strain P6497) TaxID=1094619 RepID=G5A4G3_PHYSP|nr:hypothetical protein PHYSODRAFT_338336 [Phytophthora sojae]EGZ09564.1 hypothetical protein PHYSODRAFT_338336 [Phytophthora sojae]|eukprot:XP_009534425.1 hypothetical protein PHYSODRAFT_338336 [Phytophthora sojae]